MQLFIRKFKEEIGSFAYPVSPGQSVALGDYGEMRRGKFIYKGNIRNRLGWEFDEPLNDILSPPHLHKFAHRSKIDFSAAGECKFHGIMEPSIQISFKSSNAFYFQSSFCCNSKIQDPVLTLEQKILNAYRFENTWKKNYVLIVTVLKAKNTFWIKSKSGNQDVTFSCHTDNELLNFGDIGSLYPCIDFKLRHSSSEIQNLSILGENDAVIGFEMMQLKGFWGRNNRFDKYMAEGQTPYGFEDEYEEYLDDSYNDDVEYKLVKI